EVEYEEMPASVLCPVISSVLHEIYQVTSIKIFHLNTLNN
ncbi:203_t:CDS:1, partial [Funneliformis caledonium]